MKLSKSSAPLLLSLGVATLGHAAAQQSVLNPGDIVFLQAASDTPDTFAFSPLKDINAGTIIHFADEGRSDTSLGLSGWRGITTNADKNLAEASYAWVAPSNISAGTVISLTGTTHNLGLATSGDNLIAYQGTVYNPQFVGGLGWDSGDPFIVTGTASSNNSYLPSSLALGSSAVEASAFDNTAYTAGPTSGTAGSLATAAFTGSNWTGNNTTLPAGPSSLTVTGATAAPAATVEYGGYTFGVNATSYTQNAVVAPMHTTLGALSVINQTGTLDLDGGNGFNAQSLDITGGFTAASTPVLATDQGFEFTLTVDSGYGFDLTSLAFSAEKKSTGGPSTVGLYQSDDGFATSTLLATLSLAGTVWGFLDFADTDPTLLTGTNTFRIYGSNSVVGGGLELDEVWIGGQITAVPEPASALLGSLGLIALLRRRRVG